MQNKTYYLDRMEAARPSLNSILVECSHLLNRYYLEPHSWESTKKDDDSLVTTADHACHEFLVEKLASLNFNIPIISEENSDTEMAEFRQNPPAVYWLIDPLDGTSGFVRGTGHFAINVALVHDTQAIAGWISWPRIGVVCWAFGDQVFSSGTFAFDVVEPESATYLLELRAQTSGLVVFSSASQAKRKKEVMEALAVVSDDIHICSLGAAVKFCAMFKGYGDIYPRLAGTCLWDLAAGQVLLKAKGGNIFRLDGSEMDFKFEQGVLNPYFLAVADANMSNLEPMLDTLRSLAAQFNSRSLN